MLLPHFRVFSRTSDIQIGRGRQLSRTSYFTIQNRSDIMINALFNLSCSYSSRVVIHQPMSQTFGLSLIWTAGEWPQTDLLSTYALLIYLAAVVIISFVQRRQVFLTTNESLISSWSCLSIDTLSFYSTMQSLDLLTLHFFRCGISKARCFKHGQRCYLMIQKKGQGWCSCTESCTGLYTSIQRVNFFFLKWKGGICAIRMLIWNHHSSAAIKEWDQSDNDFR